MSFPVAPSNVQGSDYAVGQAYTFLVTGSTSGGTVWGTGIYTADSLIVMAAVHAGLVGAGEQKAIKVTVLDGQSSYTGTTAHGVTTQNWGSWNKSYSLALDTTTGSITPNSSTTPGSVPVGQPINLNWNATATLGLAYREGTVQLPGGGLVPIARVYAFEFGMLGPQPFLPTGGKGTYVWTSRYTDESINTGPPFTYGTGYIEQQVSFVVTALSQPTVAVSPATITVALGTEVTFAASGGAGTGAFEWGGDASGQGINQAVTFATAGVRTVTVKKVGDSTYADSNTATATVTVTKLAQATVTLAPLTIDVPPGTQVTFTAGGGSGTGDYQWGGDASGAGTTKQVTFSTAGVRTVTVKRLGDATYLDSTVLTATINVTVNVIVPASTTTPALAPYGTAVTLKWNATATLGLAYREGTIVKPDTSVVLLGQVTSSQAGMLGPQAFVDTAQRGVYAWTSRYADQSINTGPPYTYGTGYKEQMVQFQVNGLAQGTVSVSPHNPSAFVGDDITFTVVGGSGSGGCKWRVFFYATSQQETIVTPGGEFTMVVPSGQFAVFVTKLEDFTYNQSAESAASTVVPIRQNQPLVTISPTAVTVEAGTTVTFAAIGGAGTGNYTWTGATGTGATKDVVFNVPGMFGVSVFKAADTLYNQSNTAVASVQVLVKFPPTVYLSASVTEGAAPLNTVLTWDTANADTVELTGPGIASTASSGQQLVTGLLTGVKTYVLKATNVGGTTTTTVQVIVDLTPVDTNGFTVHFTDQTVLRADTWLWDFGDGSSTSTVRNPIHTYADLGLYNVTLTVTCDGRTDVKQKLINIGCNPNDPLPFTPSWDGLVNEEDYPPFDDPRYVGTDFTSPLGPSASRQSGPANPNWTMCTTVDYCDGPDELDVPQDTRFARRWKATFHANKSVVFGQADLPLIGAPDDMGLVNLVGADYITVSLDALSAPYFAYQVDSAKSKVHFRVAGSPRSVLFFGQSPRLFSEVIINPIAELCDVVLFYVRDGKLCVRLQREQFTVEHLLVQPSIYGEELAVLTKVDANRDQQRIYVYGKTLGGKRLLFRSGLYPSFPSPDPIRYDAPPEAGKTSVTFTGGATAYIDTVDFTSEVSTLDSVTHAMSSVEPVTQVWTLVDGTYARDKYEFGTLRGVLVDGTSSYHQGLGTGEVILADGTYVREAESSVHELVLVDGTSSYHQGLGTGEVILADGTYAFFSDHGTHEVVLTDGAHRRWADVVLDDRTLGVVLHQRGTEAGENRVSLEVVRHMVGTHAATHHETLGIVHHLTGTYAATHHETLGAVRHLPGTELNSQRWTLASLSHLAGRDKGRTTLTLSGGRTARGHTERSRTANTFTGGEHAFGLLTFDNTDSDHFDGVKFSWDLNVSGSDPDIA